MLEDLTVHDPLEVRVPDSEGVPGRDEDALDALVLGPHHEVAGMATRHRAEGDHQVAVDDVLLGRPGQVTVGSTSHLLVARKAAGPRPRVAGGSAAASRLVASGWTTASSSAARPWTTPWIERSASWARSDLWRVEDMMNLSIQ